MEFDLEYPITNDFIDIINNDSTCYYPSLFSLESQHMVSDGYIQSLQDLDFDASLRQETISLIFKLSEKFDQFLSHLAVNYLDRFFSAQGMPQAQPWIVRLLAVTCISLAAKMMTTDFTLSDFQCAEGVIFDLQSIERMEKLILAALKWRMRSITPLSFLNFFVSMFNHKDPHCKRTLRTRALEIVFRAQTEVKVLEFKPSIVAASALLYASHELFPLQFPCFLKVISSSNYVNKEKLSRCRNLIEKIVMEGYDSVIDAAIYSSVVTPVNVLDLHYWSSSCSVSSSEDEEGEEQFVGGIDHEHHHHEDEREAKRQRKTDCVFSPSCYNATNTTATVIVARPSKNNSSTSSEGDGNGANDSTVTTSAAITSTANCSDK